MAEINMTTSTSTSVPLKKKSYFSHPAWILIIALILLIISHALPLCLASEVIKEIGIAIIISVTLVVALETNHYKDYFMGMFKGQATELLIDDKYLEGLSLARQKKLKEKVDKLLFFRQRNYDTAGLWPFLNTEMAELLNGYYFDEYHMNSDCEILQISEQTVIKKKTYRRMIFVNPTHNSIKLQFPVNCSMMPITGIDDSDIFKIDKVMIDKKDYSVEVTKLLKNQPTSVDSTDRYCLSFYCDYYIELKANSRIEVSFEVDTIVPITDQSYSHRIARPCKKYYSKFTVHSSDYTVEGWGFAFNDTKKLHCNRQKRWMEIEFRDWILPGDGIIFLLHRKH
ncbi:hypothetical protein SPFL3102_02657 [Sporomusaceae bacterium FL31]|nr:hypothetical protein SPFL3101_02632 [Sporomusaceae bacterium FL31]GCE34830.1 hypothetical protein SPFL3102_02657 [Sporomusaceae bacterium]